MAQKPYQSTIQDMVYNIEVGIGMRLIRRVLYVVFMLAMMLLYTATQFKGFDEPQSMDMAQTARNLAQGKGYSTSCVRPLSLWLLKTHKPGVPVNLGFHPDTLNPPLYPILVSIGFKLAPGALAAKPDQGWYGPEQWVVLPMNHLFTLLTGIMVFLFGRRLFDARVGLLGMSMFFLSDVVWADSIHATGLSLLAFLTAVMFYAALSFVEAGRAGRKGWPLLAPFLVSVLCAVLAFHTRYSALALAPGVLLLFGLGLGKGASRWIFVWGLLYVAGLAPWLLYTKLKTGQFLGLIPYVVLDGAGPFKDGALFRQMELAVGLKDQFPPVRDKWFSNLAYFARHYFPDWNAGLLGALFTVTFLFRFVRRDVREFRWGVGLALLGTVGLTALAGREHLRLIHCFLPIVLVYGIGFFYVLLARLQLPYTFHEIMVTAGLVLVSAGPLLFTLLPPRADLPYPPYYPPHISFVTRLLEPREVICTDIPWATAWYGERVSVELPSTLNGFYDINDYVQRVSAVYFTPQTRDLPYVRSLKTGPYKTWFPVMEGRLPPDFPLTKGFPLNNMDQLYLTDYARWRE